jgi:acid phosphatase (class A)
MRQKSLAATLTVLLVSSSLNGQTKRVDSAIEKSSKAPSSHNAYFIDPLVIDLLPILPPPPDQNSDTTKAELVDLHRIEKSRTPKQIAAAQADDQEQDIFIFKNVLGQNFTPDSLPLTVALSAHIHNDEGVASKPLKTSFSRSRPFQFDSSLHPVCELSKEPNSYPSGHTLSGYLLAFALVQMVPEKQQEIMQRADDYAHNRLVCGVHYASDLDTSRKMAYAMFGYMLASPRFQQELAAAREETRLHLGLSPTVPRS